MFFTCEPVKSCINVRLQTKIVSVFLQIVALTDFKAEGKLKCLTTVYLSNDEVNYALKLMIILFHVDKYLK